MGRLPALLLVLLCGAAGPGRGGAPRLLRFSGQVPENSPAGTRVRGLRVPLRRLLGPGEPPGEWALEGDGASRFSLQRRPGGGRGLLLLRTAERLDREAQPEYGLRLRRRRAGRSPREALLRVRVLDRNDHRPRLPPARPLEVDELAPLGTEVARLRASDGDEGANARLTYRPWPPGAGSRLLFVVPRSGQVLAVGSLLGLRRLRLCVAAHDHGRPRPLRSPPRCLGLAVRGRRAAGAGGRRRRWAPSLPPPERPPGPGSRRYTARLPPGARVGDTVFTVPPSRDRAAGGWFELASPGASPVGVDRASGRLYLRRELRAGGRAEVLVKVHRGGGRDNDWYLCHVTLLAPEEELLSWGMYPYPYLARVDPDARKGTLVYQLVAYYSNNENTSAGVTYTLIAGGEERFRVDKDTGVIMTTGLPLTWNKEYVVTVEATNEYGNKSPYASISILVGARPPQFTNMSYSVFVPENTPAGEKVAVVEAVSFQSQPLSYTLLTNPSGLFRVRQESGELSLTHPVDYESEHHLYHLLLKATEVESTLSSVTEVMVHITDENDCSPEFQHSIYSRDDIPETIPVGTSLLQVLATDCDSGSNSEITYFIQSTDFSITRHGVINSNQRLNFERANHMYEFVVIAVDKGHPPRTGTASVRIRMANVNDEAPVFSQPIYRTFISEDAGPSTLVATVRAKDPDGDGLLYLITGGNEEGNFELDSQKGIIKLRRNPPPNLKGPQYTLNITAIDDNASGGPTPLSSFAEVIVGVNDINNNKPVFRECTYYSDSTWVLENQPPGTYVLQVEAYDADLGVNGEVKYGLMHRDGASLGFSIDPDTGVITTTQSFDREKQREYTLSVTATDQAQEPLIGVCQITVLIADVNDNDPKFENSRYQYFLSEDTPVGMSFLRVAAHDSDQGVNAAVTYSVLEHQLEYFQINPSTGWVYVNRLLSQTTRISCYIVATDGGNRSSTVELTVTVTNALSRPPQWEQSRYWVTIPENTTRDTKIVTIKATSPLGDPRVTYNLEEGQVPETNMPVRFYLKPNRADGSASLLVAEPLDFETTKFFTLTVRAQNVAMTPLASFTTVCVNITDVNDNVPFFVSSNYEVSVPEGADVGKSVVQVLATDLDSGLHGEVHYLILKDASKDYQFFTIEPKTGIISTHASFDREKRASYLIEVQSQDSSESARPGVHGQPNTDTAYVRIFVSDVNDNTPAFPQSVYEVSIDEDRDVGSPVVTATAVDEDEGANAKLRYQITSGNAKGVFDVEPEVGTVFIAQPLDYEQEQRYELRLVASDGKWENHTLIIINVANKNDEAPVFTQNEYQGSVLEELTDLPVLVLKVSATDPDQAADQNAISYSLHGHGASSEFSINENTGEISANKRLDREKQSTWRFLVLATDESGEGLTGFADVIIEVRDMNDNAPLFLCVLDGCFMGHVPEDSPADTPVMEMTAVDLDDPKAGILPTTVLGQVHAPDDDDWDRKIYQFEGKTSRYFILNDNSGLLAIKEGTPPGTYNIRVRVIDGVWPDVVSTVKVIVKDIKDDALRNAGSIQIKDITPEEFISQSPEKQSKYYQMKKLLSEIVSVQLENVHIFSVLNSTSQTQGVDVWFAVYGPPYYKAEKLNGNVAASRVWLENILDINITQIGIDECMTANCTQSSGCISKHEQSHVPTITTAGSISLVSVTVLSHALCGCAARESPHLSCSSYQTNPCLHGGTCVDTDLGYRCKCSANFHGPDCQQTKHSFRGHGYAWFPPLKPCFENRISLEFITEVADGLLLYHGPVARGQPREREDFIALELSGGIPSLTVSHSSGELFLQLSRKVNVADRRWHNIKIINDGKAMKLILDHCVNISVRDNDSVIKKISQMDLSACEASGETVGSQSMGRLFSGHQPLQLGGVKKILPYHNSQRHFRGFVGCIRNVIVDSKVYDLEHPAESLNSAPGCALTDKMCQSGGMASCGAHGKCVGGWDFFRCDCSPGYAGPACEKVLPEWAFGRDSWIHYEPRSILSTQSTQIQLMVRTRISHSTLLSLASADGNGYIRLEVAEGFFSVNFSLGDKNHSVRMRTLRINNGQWVLLTMERYNNEFTLRVNSGGGDQEVTSVLGANRWFEMDWASVVLGNRLPNHSESDFQGCMRDVQLNGQPLLVEGKSTEFGLILRRQGVTMGCHSSACSSQPCYSPFLCVDLWRKYECRCPAGKVEVTDNLTGLRHCTSSPCGHWTCRNGGTCVAQSQDKTICQCPEGYKGRWCEISQVKAGRPVGLSSGSILAISMCLLVFLALLVSYTVWSQWGSSGFRKGGIYHIPEERESWEDVRENVFNYNEEGGGERDQNAYDIDELKKPLHTIPHFSLRSAAPHSRTPTGPKRDSLPKHGHQKQSTSAVTSVPDFKEYVSQIIWNADNDLQSLPADTIHFYCLEGQCSLAGSLSSLDSISGDEDLNYDCLQEWGSKFDKLKELYKVSNEHL
ncbi:neural-cadherin-like isoform 3-T3 [Theristicus caerulescens]